MEVNATLLVSAISFIVFIFIMNAILYNPVLKVMEKREDYINSNQDEAQQHKQNAKGLLNDRDNKLASAIKKSRDIVASKADAIKAERDKVLADTKAVVSSYYNDKKDGLSHQKNETIGSMKNDVADLANNITTRLLGDGVAFEPLQSHEIDEVMNKNV